MTDQDELAALLSRTAEKDELAFAQLYALSSARLHALLRRMLKRQDWAEEALQDVYLRIWQKAETYTAERGTPLAWLLTIARYRALDLLRQRRPEVPVTDDMPEAEDTAPTPHELSEISEDLGALQQCMDGLAEEQRNSILLAFYEGFSHAQLAERLQAPLGTVKSWVRRGLSRLRACIDGLVAA